MAGDLTVWLSGVLVATVDDHRHRPRLAYSEEALSRFPLGTPLLSLTLPLRPEQFTQSTLLPFLDGLLPEGIARLAVANDFNLRAEDTVGLIRAIGRDCAGAVVIQPRDDPDPPLASTLRAEPLEAEDIGRIVANLRTAPLGIDERVRVSLGGVQEKLLLTKMPDGAWGRPIEGSPSTHILKPPINRYPKTIENEAFCMRVASHLGLEVARAEPTIIGSRQLLVVERYDRVVHPDGVVDRLHQEDFCQATGTPPERKYEDRGGPPLRRIADILQSVATPPSTERLLQAVTLNVLIGNGDAHAKNFSLLHQPSGSLTLAPLYDLMCTLLYGDDRLAMAIDHIEHTDKVTTGAMVNEAVRWGFSRERAQAIIQDILERAPSAIAQACGEIDNVPDDLIAVVTDQIERLLAGE